jgi:RNA polymerase sigma factor (sigma-70 family)
MTTNTADALMGDILLAVDQAYQAHKFTTLDEEDARQEGILACLVAVPKFRPEKGTAISYFRYAARWAMIAASKKRHARPAALVEPAAQPREHPEGLFTVARAVQKLKPRWREIILRRYWLGQTQAEIGMILECTHQNVHIQEQKALVELRRSVSGVGCTR